MTRLALPLALLMAIVLATPVMGRSAADSYGDALDMMSGSRAVTTAAADDSVDIAAEMKALVAYATQQLNLAKAELKQLGIAYRAAMRDLRGDEYECERELLTSTYVAERIRLRGRIRDYRQIRGDRRGFFTKAWHSIGPAGRRIARAIGDGAFEALTSGGGLGGGVLRRIAIRAGANEASGALLRGLNRTVDGRTAAAVAAAESACRDGDDGDLELDEGVAAVAPGTYVGEFPLDLSADDFVSAKVIEANSAELRVSENGAIVGEIGYRLTGTLDGCPGYVEESSLVVEAGQRVGSELPQALSVTYDALIAGPISGLAMEVDSVYFVCGTDVEPYIDEHGSAEVELDIKDDGTLILFVGDDLIELHWTP